MSRDEAQPSREADRFRAAELPPDETKEKKQWVTFTRIDLSAMIVMTILAFAVSAFNALYGEVATATAFKFTVALAMPTMSMGLIFARRYAKASGAPSFSTNVIWLTLLAITPISVLLNEVGIAPLIALLADDAVGPTALFEAFGMGMIASGVQIGMAYATAD